MKATRLITLMVGLALAVGSRGWCCCTLGARCSAADQADAGSAAPSCCGGAPATPGDDEPGPDAPGCDCPTLGPTLDTAQPLAAPDLHACGGAPAALIHGAIPAAVVLALPEGDGARPAPRERAGIPRARSLHALRCQLTC
jgi:hypothetical protein